jgi:signal transduction histidine kinase/CheY-like chemotaxis protein
MVGYEVEEMTGEAYSIFTFPDGDRDVIDRFDLKMNGPAHSTRFATVLRHRDGKRVDVELSGGTIRFEGKPANLVFVRDTTETQRLRELESRAQRLETAGRIAGQVAHDFNNLLAPMVAYPEFIREELSPEHPALAFVNSIEESAQQIADINQQLLTLGRRGHYNQEPLNLNGVVRQVLNDMGPLPEALTCETDLDQNLFNIMGGHSQILRVLANLFQNARDAMQDNGILKVKTENFYVDDVSIKYCRVPKGEYVKLTVSDNGCGIPAEQTEKVFDPFFTSKATDRKRGSGLGLSVVDAVVKDHNGYIDLSSRIGEGTSMYLYFPITRETVDGRPPEVDAVGGTETVLVVDDDEVQRDVSMKLLTKLGYRADTAESGEQALEKCRSMRYDLLILDMVMPPGIDGTETYRRTLEFNPSQRAIIVSGFAESDRVAEAQALGAGAFIRKPLTRNGLARAVREELDRHPRPEPAGASPS